MAASPVSTTLSPPQRTRRAGVRPASLHSRGVCTDPPVGRVLNSRQCPFRPQMPCQVEWPRGRAASPPCSGPSKLAALGVTLVQGGVLLLSGEEATPEPGARLLSPVRPFGRISTHPRPRERCRSPAEPRHRHGARLPPSAEPVSCRRLCVLAASCSPGPGHSMPLIGGDVRDHQ